MRCTPLPRLMYEVSARLFRRFRQSWQRLCRFFFKTAFSPNLAPANFFLPKKAKMGAGRLEPGPGQHQKHLGGGHHITDRRRLHRRLQKLAGALQKVRPPRRRVHRKLFRNKYPRSSNCSQIVDGFAFVFIHTSYILVLVNHHSVKTNITPIFRHFQQFL